ncbi:hypothetical protein MHM582_3609, partial [Microbacterium sp. HM58-2]
TAQNQSLPSVTVQILGKPVTLLAKLAFVPDHFLHSVVVLMSLTFAINHVPKLTRNEHEDCDVEQSYLSFVSM